MEDKLAQDLYLAFLQARKGKLKTEDEYLFEINLQENLYNLRQDIINRNYKPGRGITFVVRDPVVREIFAAPFRDRVVHHYLYNKVEGWWDKRFIYDSYSCRKGKGTLFGITRLERHIQSASNNYKEPTKYMKMDVKGYFMNMRKELLYNRVIWGLKKQYDGQYNFEFKILDFLWHEIIFDDPTIGVKRKGSISDWDKVPDSKSLFCQPKGQGIVIGNLSSQLLSNILLDELDRFVKFELKYKHYGRYVDDFFIIRNDESDEPSFREAQRKISEFLGNLGLEIHGKKTKIQPIERGVEFLGAVIYPRRSFPGKRIVRNFKRSVRDLMEDRGDVSIEQIQSYLGHMGHLDSDKLVKEVFERAGWT